MSSMRINSISPKLETNWVDNLDFTEAEQKFVQLLETENLDGYIEKHKEERDAFETLLLKALKTAYSEGSRDSGAHRFLQRILYRINRLNLFWYDDLQHYKNERSLYLSSLRNLIEKDWQEWELTELKENGQLPDEVAFKGGSLAEIEQALTDRCVADLNPSLSENDRFMREEMTEIGYSHLLKIASFDGLVEASRLSRILGGAANEVQCMLVRILMEEYGGGKYSRKHSTFFARMMTELGLKTEPEAYFDLVPWEVLASINHNFLLTERKRFFLRYNGGLTYFEIAGPSIYRNYLAAAERLKLSSEAMGYWELHIREDERHGRWMLDDVALPLAKEYPENAFELVLGYDQEKFMASRAGAAVIKSIYREEGLNK